MDTGANKRRKLETVQSNRIEGMTILQLNIYCLLHIFSFLDMKGLMNAENVCHVFKDLAQETYKKFKSLDLKKSSNTSWPENLSTADTVKMLRRVGPHINTLILISGRILTGPFESPPPPFIWQFFTKLQTVHFNFFTFNSDICAKMSPALKNVTIVRMSNCDLHPYLFSVLFNLPQLTEFTLEDTSEDVGQFLQQFKEIQSISLVGFHIYPNVFINFCKANPQLRILKIRRLNNADCIQAIASNLKNLECLYIPCNANIQLDHYLALMDLPKIKQLKLDIEFEICNYYIDVLLKQISSYNQLEYLEIVYNWGRPVKITHTIGKFTKLKELKLIKAKLFNDATLECLSELKLLEKLHIPCTQVTASGLMNLIERFKMIQYIDVCYCKMDKDDLIPLIPKILDCLKNRNHTLEISINEPYQFMRSHEINPQILKFTGCKHTGNYYIYL